MNIVVSLARSRSSTVMRALIEMGLPVKYEKYNESVNPDGDFECLESSHGIHTESPEYGPDTTLKLLVPAFLFRSTIGPDVKIILLLRSPAGVVESQGKVGMGQPRPHLRRFNYWRLMAQMLDWFSENKNPVFIVDTDDLMLRPEAWLQSIADFTGCGADKVKAAASLIDKAKSYTPSEEIEDEATAIYQEWRALCYTVT